MNNWLIYLENVYDHLLSLEVPYYLGQSIPAFIIYRLLKLKEWTFINKMTLMYYLIDFTFGLLQIFVIFKLAKER